MGLAAEQLDVAAYRPAEVDTKTTRGIADVDRSRFILNRNTPLPSSSYWPRERSNALLDRRPQLANYQVQLPHIETRLAIIFSSQLEKGESILVGSNATVGRLVQIDQATLDYKHDQCRFW